MVITRGTTPTITYSFKVVNPSDIEIAFLTITQAGKKMAELALASAVVGESSVSWQLTQAETLALNDRLPAEIQMRYRLKDGTAHATAISRVPPGAILKDGEI